MCGIVRWVGSTRLGRREPPAESAWRAILWWEARRISFNAIVGATGLVTGLAMAALLLGFAAGFRIPWDYPDPPILVVFMALAYGLMANVCYTLGWIAELGVRIVRPDRSDRFASSAFASGVVFSVALTLSPLIPWLVILVVAARQAPK